MDAYNTDFDFLTVDHTLAADSIPDHDFFKRAAQYANMALPVVASVYVLLGDRQSKREKINPPL